MNQDQMVNIAIKIGEIANKADFTLIAAIIGAVAGIVAAGIAGFVAYKVNVSNKEHDKQWAYVSKRSLLIDNAIEIFSRMIFNKILIADNNDSQAYQNFFDLQKDALVIESQMVVYAPQEMTETFVDFKNFLVKMPHQDIRKQWDEMYKKGNGYLLLCRRLLKIDVSSKFTQFIADLEKESPATSEGVLTATADTMGTVSTSTLFLKLKERAIDKNKQI